MLSTAFLWFFVLFPTVSMVFPMGKLVVSEAFHVISHGLYGISFPFYLFMLCLMLLCRVSTVFPLESMSM